MTSKVWYALDIVADPAASEAVESALNELDALGIEIDQLKKDPGAEFVVTGYFSQQLPDDLISRELSQSLDLYGFSANSIKKRSWRSVEDQDWLAEWKKHWRPTEAGKFLIAPPWCVVTDSDKIVIRIEPNMAFGTGTHETTQLCLEAISELYTPGDTFLDVGTGTGILSIGAAKLGGTDILAVDTDADSIAIARSNALDNGVAGSIKFIKGEISRDTPVHDLVCANLTLDVILPILGLLIDKSSKRLVLSGILADQADTIRSELMQKGFAHSVTKKGEWISVVIELAA